MKGSVKIIGNSKAINALALKNVLNGEIASALYASAEEIMTDSKNNYVPVDTGDLRRSGTVMEPNYDPTGKISVSLGYGMPYAKVVHDRPPEIGQGKVKYLEIPFLAHIKNAEKLLLKHISSGIQQVMKTRQPTNKAGWRRYQENRAQTKRVDHGASG
jgi:hypothetical protein